MNRHIHPFGNLFREPAAFVPPVMSFIALTVVAGTLAVKGIGYRPADEETPAHIWQLLMAGQLPVILFFAIQWLPRTPRQAGSSCAAICGGAGSHRAGLFAEAVNVRPPRLLDGDRSTSWIRQVSRTPVRKPREIPTHRYGLC